MDDMLGIIEDIKQKITDNQYKNLLENLSKIKPINKYLVTVFFIKLEVNPYYDTEDNENEIDNESQIIIKNDNIKLVTDIEDVSNSSNLNDLKKFINDEKQTKSIFLNINELTQFKKFENWDYSEEINYIDTISDNCLITYTYKRKLNNYLIWTQ